MPTSQNPTIRVVRWPTEFILKCGVILAAIAIWILLAISLIGFVYVLIIAATLAVLHVYFIAHIRGNGIQAGPEQFPELYRRVCQLSQSLGLREVPEVYVLQQGGALNAFATKFLGSKIIVLYSDLLEACGDNTDARDMIVAHELGHLHAGHLKWRGFLFPGYAVPFLGTAYSRACEYTCDRYGLAAIQNIENAKIGLAILAAGPKMARQVQWKAVGEQMKRLNFGWMTLAEWFFTHPPLIKRIVALDPAIAPAGDTVQRGAFRAVALLFLFGFILPAALAGTGYVLFHYTPLKSYFSQKGENRASSSKSSGESRTVEDATRSYQITLPPNWQKTSALNPTASLQLYSPRANAYWISFAVPKSDSGAKDLADYSEITRKALVAKLEDIHKYVVKTTQVDGKPAIQFMIDGEAVGKDQDKKVLVPLRYLHTVVEGKNNYYQMVGWTMRPMWEANRMDFVKMTIGFKENP